MKRLIKLFLCSASVALMAQAANAQQALPQQTDSYFVSAQQELFSKLAEQPNTGRAKNVILFVLDGFSIPTLTAARIYEGQQSRGRRRIQRALLREAAALCGAVEDLHA